MKLVALGSGKIVKRRWLLQDRLLAVSLSSFTEARKPGLHQLAGRSPNPAASCSSFSLDLTESYILLSSHTDR